MKNTFVVYSKKSIVTVRQLVDDAKKMGLELRFMGMGGFSFRLEKDDKAYFDSPLQDGILLIGGFDPDKESLKQFDEAAEKNDSEFASVMLHTDKLPWCEIHSTHFHYPSCDDARKKLIDSWTFDDDQAFVHSATTRYMIDNLSRRKTGQRLAEFVTLILRHLSGGVVTEYGGKVNHAGRQFKSAAHGRVTSAV